MRTKTKVLFFTSILALLTTLNAHSQLTLDAYSQAELIIDGDVGIGTSTPDQKLTVKGKIHAEEVIVDLNVPAPDYVFEEGYNLRELSEVKEFIETNKHLPEVPSAKQMEEEGVSVSEMNMLLLKKVEELTLYVISQQETLKKQQQEIESLKSQIK